MSWTRGPLAVLAMAALLGGAAGCGSGDGPEREREGEVAVSPVGKVLDHTDEQGRHYREIGKDGAPEVTVEVQPDEGDGWEVRLTVRNFRFSPPRTRPVATAGHGVALLYLDGHRLARLRTGEHHLSGRQVPRGTHQLTARLYADDLTVWAVRGTAIESTADITASAPGAPPAPSDAG
ncbi:hypothetical protein AB0L85_28830 [Streptomyces sp. NPDC052051]|uniref:hypothetical protein n=1 Tax=Streptomyces sp. NPDC052051 TaxID=3154649 RepID=UPI00343023DC